MKKINYSILLPAVAITGAVIMLGGLKARNDIFDNKLENLEQLADIDNSGHLDREEFQNMNYACGLTNESLRENERPNYRIAIDKLKQGIDTYRNALSLSK